VLSVVLVLEFFVAFRVQWEFCGFVVGQVGGEDPKGHRYRAGYVHLRHQYFNTILLASIP
jgi:hypothetical protein